MKLAAACLLVMVTAQSPPPTVRAGVLFGGIGMGPFAPVDDPAAAARWKEAEARAVRIKSKLRPLPETGGAFEMVQGTREDYERRLFAIGTSISPSRDPKRDDVWIQEQAIAFVEGLRPCYEWEGSSHCPQKEAEFAEYWQKWNATGAFRDFLPLLASHRWTCAAEALVYEKKPTEAAAAHDRSKALLTVALASRDPLMRYVARDLQKDRRCHTGP